jgi:hypothetical protein
MLSSSVALSAGIGAARHSKKADVAPYIHPAVLVV